MSLLLAIAIGSTVSWADATTGFLYCGKLTDIDYRGRAWIVPDTAPYWFAIVPFADVSEGCPRP